MFFSPAHIETIARRSAAQEKKGTNVDELVEFFLAFHVEGVHPLEGGVLRRKSRRDRRPGMKRENPLIFYPRHVAETLWKSVQYARWFWWASRVQKRIYTAPDRHAYSDIATAAPVTGDEAKLALLTQTRGSKAAVNRQKVIERGRDKALASSA